MPRRSEQAGPRSCLDSTVCYPRFPASKPSAPVRLTPITVADLSSSKTEDEAALKAEVCRQKKPLRAPCLQRRLRTPRRRSRTRGRRLLPWSRPGDAAGGFRSQVPPKMPPSWRLPWLSCRWRALSLRMHSRSLEGRRAQRCRSFTDGFWVHQEAFRVTEAAKATTFRANQLGLLKHETRSLRNAKDALASFRELNVPEGTLALCDKLESRQLQRLEEVCVKFPPCSGCKPGRRVQLTRGRQIRDCAKVRPRRCGPLLWPPWVWMHLGHCKRRTSL